MKAFADINTNTCTTCSEIPYDINTVSTVCPRSLDPVYLVTYFIHWVKTSWTAITTPASLNFCNKRDPMFLREAAKKGPSVIQPLRPYMHPL